MQVHDVTSQWSCFGIWGPRARDVLGSLTPDSLENEAFPYMSVREITVGDVPVRALRVTYVGELGWELYCPTEYGLGLWRALWEAGEPHGMVAAGYRAIDSMRLEKGYRVWGADITPDETPHEAGLGFCVKDDKEFIGRDALAAAQPRTKLCCLVLEDPRSVALGNEPVRVDGEIRGRVTTGGYGYTVERSIAYAYLPPELAERGHGRGGGDLRRVDRGRGGARAAVRPEGGADQELGPAQVAGPVQLERQAPLRRLGLAPGDVADGLPRLLHDEPEHHRGQDPRDAIRACGRCARSRAGCGASAPERSAERRPRTPGGAMAEKPSWRIRRGAYWSPARYCPLTIDRTRVGLRCARRAALSM